MLLPVAGCVCDVVLDSVLCYCCCCVVLCACVARASSSCCCVFVLRVNCCCRLLVCAVGLDYACVIVVVRVVRLSGLLLFLCLSGCLIVVAGCLVFCVLWS